MAAAPVFAQVLGPQLYALPVSSGDAGWCGYVLPGPGSAPSIAIQASFQNSNGHYVFAHRAPSLATADQAAAFVARVLAYVATKVPAGGRACVWISDPDAPQIAPDSVALVFGPSTTVRATVLRSDTRIPIGSRISLNLNAPSLLTVAPDGGALVVTASDSAVTVMFSTSPQGAGPTIAPLRAAIQFVGPYRGCLLVGGLLPYTTTLPLFQAGVRYAHGGDTPESQVYPILRPADIETVPYASSIDPLDIFNSEATDPPVPAGVLRTQFALTPAADVVLPSWLRSQSGKPIGLVPQWGADANGAPRPYAGALTVGPVDRTDDGPLYFACAGDFGLAFDGQIVQGAGSPAELLCGLFGTETLSFQGYGTRGTNDVLRFVVNQPAFAPAFPFAAASLDNTFSGASTPRLDSTLTTSWATIVPSAPRSIIYTSQPDGVAMYRPGTPSAAVLSSYAPGSAFEGTIPLAAYAGLSSTMEGLSAEHVVPFEAEIIAAERKRIVDAANINAIRERQEARRNDPAPDPGGSIWTATPQGFVAELVGSRTEAHYKSVTFARPTSGPDLAAYECDAELQSALQTNQLFLAAVDRTHLGPPPGPSGPNGTQAFSDNITIQDWTMRVRVGQGVTAGDYRNVLIMKFCDGPLVDRILNPQKWTAAESFSLASTDLPPDFCVSGLSQWLQTYCTNAIALADDGNALFQPFAATIRDPNWRGILALAVDLDVSVLPEQLRALSAGIDATQFCAHHIGIAANPVRTNGSVVELAGTSSMFGLIDYEVPAYRDAVAKGGDPNTPVAAATSGPYAFTVLQLSVLFQNSAMVDFQSHVQLTIDSLFDSDVLAAYGPSGAFPSNSIVLKGTYQRQGDRSLYVYRQDRPVVLTLDSNVLQAIGISRAEFNAGGTSSDASTIASRFQLWGALDFSILTTTDDPALGEDVLSFGSPAGTLPENLGSGLAFGGLAIELSSPAATPSAITYRFDLSNFALDLATSAPRAKSLYSTFALQLRGFTHETSGKRPADYGFLTVRTSNLALQSIGSSWYGLTFKITMGTPGGLVSKAGFDSSFLIAWSPASTANEASAALFLGLSLPGAAPGAKLISIQGVLKLSVGSIELIFAQAGGTGDPTYCLSLGNVGLTFLGVVKLPPGATINFFLFGDPAGTGSLGWYAAYIEKDKGSQTKLAPVSETPALAPAGTEER